MQQPVHRLLLPSFLQNFRMYFLMTCQSFWEAGDGGLAVVFRNESFDDRLLT